MYEDYFCQGIVANLKICNIDMNIYILNSVYIYIYIIFKSVHICISRCMYVYIEMLPPEFQSPPGRLHFE